MNYDSNFTVTFAQLPGTEGDEIWRAFAVRRRFHVTVKYRKIESCTVQMYDNHRTSEHTDCKESDLPYQLHVPWLIQKIAMYHPYPIIFDSYNKTSPRRSITCFGP
jgi:hypothetical protein